jgi:hypothetical protein
MSKKLSPYEKAGWFGRSAELTIDEYPPQVDTDEKIKAWQRGWRLMDDRIRSGVPIIWE